MTRLTRLTSCSLLVSGEMLGWWVASGPRACVCAFAPVVRSLGDATDPDISIVWSKDKPAKGGLSQFKKSREAGGRLPRAAVETPSRGLLVSPEAWNREKRVGMRESRAPGYAQVTTKGKPGEDAKERKRWPMNICREMESEHSNQKQTTMMMQKKSKEKKPACLSQRW